MSNNAAKILIIEDDEKLAHTIERRLDLEGFDVDTAFIKSSTIAEDILKIKNQMSKSKFDIIILDYVFDRSPVMSTPETSGLAVLKAIREHDKHIPVIIFTVYPSDIDQVKLVQEGVSFTVIKGQGDAIVEAIRKFLRERDEIIEELEEIVSENPKAEQPLLTIGTRAYSLKEALNEIKKGSPEGKMLYRLYRAGLAEILMKLKKEERS